MLSAYQRYARDNKVLEVPEGYSHTKQLLINCTTSSRRQYLLLDGALLGGNETMSKTHRLYAMTTASFLSQLQRVQDDYASLCCHQTEKVGVDAVLADVIGTDGRLSLGTFPRTSSHL